MTSKAEKKRSKKAAAARQRQGAGRPRQDGERYACGKLKPAKNERVIEAKRALVGDGLDIALADDPLDFIHAKGWLPTDLYRTAVAFRDVRRQARIGAPGLDSGGVAETSSTTGMQGRSFYDMTDAEVTAVFDHVFRDPPSMTAEEREAQALQRWKAMEASMGPDQRREVGLVVLEKSWPFWVTSMNLGKDLTERQAQQRKAFEDGLRAMAKAVRKPKSLDKRLPQPIEAVPDPKPRKVDDPVQFVDEDGEPVTLSASRTGKPFRVSRRRLA